ncbi:flagellar basal body rod protein FlgF [Paraburkholderia bonniea]|uniref:flagellar basal body rod protein FlgF n=1 Tax=Paraburkholderia bonniea TaxID=2152891 RepID=UPI001290F2C0|nr:flagellar basal body rod protein FlgF [Paraburkholderia bonniea]WJF90793.1 flagellar basal body rod protein FlgF [Paraburkholderia bonniea]WJF94107.1 flagellar basal body rod protein FlgF [Paraburkholderia bonniea]
MDAFIYTAMSGADQALVALNVRANNLANAQTSGFRADLISMQSKKVPGYGYDSRQDVQVDRMAVNAEPGRLTDTGRKLDVAIDGPGYLALDGPEGIVYTRAGSMVLESDGSLTLDSLPVMGEGGAITLPEHDQVMVGTDGTINVRPLGETELQTVGKLLLVNPDPADVTKDSHGFIVSITGSAYEVDDSVQVKGSHLEGSNVSAVDEMMQTMALTRSFEMQMRLYKTADELSEAGNRLIRA